MSIIIVGVGPAEFEGELGLWAPGKQEGNTTPSSSTSEGGMVFPSYMTTYHG